MYRPALSRTLVSSNLAASHPWHISHPILRRRHQIRYSSSQPQSPNSPSASSGNSRTEPSSEPERQKDAIAEWRDRLRDVSATCATELRQRIDEYTAQLARAFSQFGKEINKMTGYGKIEELKRQVVEQEARVEGVRRTAREAKDAYDRAVLQRAASQREVNDLLQRKSVWTAEDVARFTALMPQDHQHEQQEAAAKARAVAAEDAVEREFSELMRVILNRYHEEQAWSDKIRSASTYGSLVVMGVNMAVFVLAIVFVEPWKRKRLAQTFERRVEEFAANNAALLESRTAELAKRLEDQAMMLSNISQTLYYSQQIDNNAEAAVAQDADMIEQASTQQDTATLAVKSNRELALALATSATAAGIVGWLARSWFG
ncbi:hypothetical protein WOLCODRAFT_136702 [Wolfiporia cocos MD-104 SS10]|uniref:Sensitive to high expression protein 9, mitochondrial n=1 Tax=Wolfiporia cocos (strain MD-104) TaxID=742152 RepID=A0A2H3JQZ3_WOLCO|nr:hypothetical protein WOLCODRAFT_136702 [Wolfiporia cocos MD-104 SS10]